MTAAAANTLTELLKGLGTSAVTVIGSYMAITAHIDTKVIAQVEAAMWPVERQVRAVHDYADSLHWQQALRINALGEQLSTIKRKR